MKFYVRFEILTLDGALEKGKHKQCYARHKRAEAATELQNCIETVKLNFESFVAPEYTSKLVYLKLDDGKADSVITEVQLGFEWLMEKYVSLGGHEVHGWSIKC